MMALSSVDAAGWSAQYSGTPPTFDPVNSPETVSVSRAGYDATAGATTHTESVTLTKRQRQLYPNQATPTANGVALSTYIYSTDTISGVTNNSTKASPKPIAAWVTPDRQLVSGTIGGSACPVEVVAFHRNARSGKQVAAVKFLITDGTNTVTATVATPTVSTAGTGSAWDKNALSVYALPATDISSLSAGMVTVNAEVYPWIGDSASVNESADNGSARREFTARYFLKRATGPIYGYVSSSGNDSTGIWHSTAATAAATPFLTILGAFNAINAARNTAETGDKADGLELRLTSGSWSIANTTANRTQNVAALTITRDPSVAKSAAILDLGAAWRPKLATGFTSPLATGCLQIRDLTLDRSASTGSITGESTGSVKIEVIFDNVDLDLSGFSGALTNATLADDYHYGTVFTSNLAGNSNLGQSTNQHRIFRGIQVNAATYSMEGWVCVGSTITAGIGFGFADATKGGIFASNKFLNPSSANAVINIATAADVDTITGFVFAQNLVESIHTTTSTAALGVAQNKGNTSHCLIYGNTFTGYGGLGRANLFYSGFANGGVDQEHDLFAVKGNIFVQLNCKGDVYGTNTTFDGALAFDHGVDCEGNFTQFNTASPATENQYYPGLRSNIGSSSTTRNDPLFTSYAGTGGSGGTPSAGAGGGDYTLQSTSPAKQLLGSALLSHDFAGTARPASSDTAGAYTLLPSGIGANSHRFGIALSSVSHVNGIAKASISKINGF